MSQQEETFILTIRKFDCITTNLVQSIYINIPDARNYRNFKVTVKDFLCIVDTPDVVPNTYTLCSNTLQSSNTYDSRTKTISQSLAVVNNTFPFIINSCSDIYYDKISNINGLHNFWIEKMDYSLSFLPIKVSNDEIIDYTLTLVVIGYN